MTKKYLLLSIFVALLNATILIALFVPRFNHPDANEYAATIAYFLRKEDTLLYPNRIIKPLPLLISVPFASFGSLKNILIAQSFIFYCISTIVMFWLIVHLYRNATQAFYGTILYSTAYPMLAYGLAPLTDTSGWFFYLCTIWLAVRFFLPRPSLKVAFLVGMVGGIGMLFKENLAAAPLFFVSLVMIAINHPLQKKITYMASYGIAFSIPIIINTLILYSLYSYSYLHWYVHAWQVGGAVAGGLGPYAYSLPRMLIELVRVFFFGWLLVVLGIINESKNEDFLRRKVLYSLIIPSLSFLLWSYPHNRIAYIAAPLLVLLGSHGLMHIHRNKTTNYVLQGCLLLCYVIINYAMLEFLLRYGVHFQKAF